MGEPFVHWLRVRYAECDLQGVVFNAHYLAYFDTTLTELWRAAFGGYQAMLDRGIDMVVAEAQLRFRAPARFDEELELAVEIAQLGNTSIHSRHRIRRGGGAASPGRGDLLVEGEMRHVLVDRSTLAKTAIPDWVREGLAPWVLGAGGAGQGDRS